MRLSSLELYRKRALLAHLMQDDPQLRLQRNKLNRLQSDKFTNIKGFNIIGLTANSVLANRLQYYEEGKSPSERLIKIIRTVTIPFCSLTFTRVVSAPMLWHDPPKKLASSP